MMDRKVLSNTLYEYTHIPPQSMRYFGTHIAKVNGNKNVVFAGDISKEKWTQVFDHGEIDHVDILCLQYLLAIGGSSVAKRHLLLRLLGHKPSMFLSEMATMLFADPKWLRALLSISEKINLKEVCVSNAYVLSKIPDPSDEMVEAARTKAPMVFVPYCLEYKKRLQEERRRKYKKEKK